MGGLGTITYGHSPSAAKPGLASPCGPIIPRWPAWRRSTPAGPSRSNKFFAMGRARCAPTPGSRRSSSTSSAYAETADTRRARAGGPHAADRGGRRLGSAARPGSQPAQLTFVVAPTASLAGGVQISARDPRDRSAQDGDAGFRPPESRERHRHAPLPPVAKNDLRAIGRTNDCILYGGQAATPSAPDDDELAELAREGPGIGLARLRHAVLRDLPALQRRLLQDRPAALQPGGGLGSPTRPPASTCRGSIPDVLAQSCLSSCRPSRHYSPYLSSSHDPPLAVRADPATRRRRLLEAGRKSAAPATRWPPRPRLRPRRRPQGRRRS